MYIHRGLVHPEPDPKKKGSPTKSTQRYRWRELLPWDLEAEASVYWEALSDDQKSATLGLPLVYWDVIQLQLDGYMQLLTSEPELRIPFGTAFQIPPNLAIRGASDLHAEMWTEGTHPEPQPLANADFIMVYDRKLCGIIELKTWWKVTDAEIDEVRQGKQAYCRFSKRKTMNPCRASITDVSLSSRHMGTCVSTRSVTESWLPSMHLCL
jgi:hypothetical protein